MSEKKLTFPLVLIIILQLGIGLKGLSLPLMFKSQATFSGADILLFGAYDGQKNDDIIVVVSGQKGNIKFEFQRL